MLRDHCFAGKWTAWFFFLCFLYLNFTPFTVLWWINQKRKSFVFIPWDFVMCYVVKKKRVPFNLLKKKKQQWSKQGWTQLTGTYYVSFLNTKRSQSFLSTILTNTRICRALVVYFLSLLPGPPAPFAYVVQFTPWGNPGFNCVLFSYLMLGWTWLD